jgi:hypothetical protein
MLFTLSALPEVQVKPDYILLSPSRISNWAQIIHLWTPKTSFQATKLHYLYLELYHQSMKVNYLKYRLLVSIDVVAVNLSLTIVISV